METRYFITKFEDPNLLSESDYIENIDFNKYMEIMNSFSQLTYSKNTGMFSENEIDKFSGTFYYQFSVKNFSKNHYSFIHFNIGSNIIVAVSEGKENYTDLNMFLEVANALKANLWNIKNKIFVNEKYLNNLKVLKINLNRKQLETIDLLENECRWFLFKKKSINESFGRFFSFKNKKLEHIEKCINDISHGNKLIFCTQKDYTMILGLNVPYFIYKNKEDYLNTHDHIKKLLEYLNQISLELNEAMYFEFNTNNQISVCTKSINGKLYYANFTIESEVEEFIGKFEDHNSTIDSLNLNETSVLDVCKKWGITPKDMILKCFEKKEKVLTFYQEDYNS